MRQNNENTEEDTSLLNSLIIALIIGIIIVIITLFLFRPEPERFTELYFNDHESLQQFSYDGRIPFAFSIVNHEGKDTDYRYEIQLNDIIYTSGSVSIPNEGDMALSQSLTVQTQFNRSKVAVILPEQDLEIHFWTEFATHIWVPVQGKGNQALECLPTNIVSRNQTMFVKARGTEADGFPIMEVWLNGKKIKELEFTNVSETKVAIPSLNEDGRIDLVFANDYAQKEGKKYVADRNIFVDFVATPDQYLSFVYDRGAWDCEDLRATDKMAWNGALRMKVMFA